jgi:hypothetical protein
VAYVAGNFDSEHLYVQWGGKLPGGETWSNGFRMRKKTAGVVDNGTALLVGIGAALVDAHQRPLSRISNSAKLSFVKVNAIAVNGKYRDGAGTNQAIYADVAGGGGTQMYPNQVALAIGLTTGFSRGPAHKGRFYVPLPNTGVDPADGLITDQEATVIKGSFNVLLTALNTVNSDYEVAVFSRKLGSAGNRKVTGIQVGRALDTQRRRRRNLKETYK